MYIYIFIYLILCVLETLMNFARFTLSPKRAPYWRNTKDDGKGWIWLAAEMMLGKLLTFWVTRDGGNW